MKPSVSTKMTFPAELLDLIPDILKHAQGRDRAVRREDLLETAQLRMPDRAITDSIMRLAIQELRARGKPICNLEDGAGYFYPTSADEYMAFESKYVAHAITTFENRDAMRETVKQWFDFNPQQMKLPMG